MSGDITKTFMQEILDYIFDFKELILNLVLTSVLDYLWVNTSGQANGIVKQGIDAYLTYQNISGVAGLFVLLYIIIKILRWLRKKLFPTEREIFSEADGGL